MEPVLNLDLTIDEVNKIIAGLNSYKKDIESLSNKIISMSEQQIFEYNAKMQEQQEILSEENKKSENKKEKKEN